MDAEPVAAGEMLDEPGSHTPIDSEPTGGTIPQEWASHKTPPFSTAPAEVSPAPDEMWQDEELAFDSTETPWQDDPPSPSDEDSGAWRRDLLAESDPVFDSGQPGDDRQAASREDSGGGRRSQETPSIRDSGVFGRRLVSGTDYDSGAWRRNQGLDSSHPGGRSPNYTSQSSLRQSAIRERLEELDAAARRIPGPSEPPAKERSLHPGAFIVVALAMLSVALIYLLGPGRSALSFILTTPTPAEVVSPEARDTPTSLPTALRPLIKETSMPSPSPSALATGCIMWDQVTAANLGQELCVKGTVKRWFATHDFPMVVIFSEEQATFIFVDTEEASPLVKPGVCIMGSGQVEIMGGERPYIEFTDPPTVCPESP